MNSPTASDSDLERRLRNLHRRLDASEAFAPALKARIAALQGVADGRARLEQRARATRERLQTEARLRRRFWWSVVATVGAGFVAASGAWLVGSPLGAVLAALGSRSAMGLSPLVIASVVLLGAWLWLAVRGAARGGLGRAAFG